MVLQNEETSSKKKLFKLCTNPDGGVRPFFQISLLGKLAHVYPPMRVIPFKLSGIPRLRQGAFWGRIQILDSIFWNHI